MATYPKKVCGSWPYWWNQVSLAWAPMSSNAIKIQTAASIQLGQASAPPGRRPVFRVSIPESNNLDLECEGQASAKSPGTTMAECAATLHHGRRMSLLSQSYHEVVLVNAMTKPAGSYESTQARSATLRGGSIVIRAAVGLPHSTIPEHPQPGHS